MNLEALALARAQEQIDKGSWRIDDAPPRKAPPVKFSRRRCRKCKTRKLRKGNRSNLCYHCHADVTPRQREMYRTGELPPRKARRASANTIRHARARLAAKGIPVPECINPQEAA